MAGHHHQHQNQQNQHHHSGRYHHHNNSGNGSNGNNFANHHRPGANSAYNSGAYSSQPKQFAEERQDVIFRRVRGILNKITPETFDKLSKELINVGLDSPRTLRGLIYLLFDKALKDLKYSSLYAKLCQQLSEKSPNFETEPGPNTFCKFLISKCEDEFERRRKATEDFDGKHELTDEEFEQKVIAKQKMLGNIKFICELGKKRLLQEEILHECIRGLLSKKKERPMQEQAQDLECLCQIMRTIGSLLDIEASRNLMNQYFERIEMYSRKPELPSRIRFMLKDVIDLRNSKWRPRPYQREDTVPQPLSRLREEAGFNNPTVGGVDKIGNTKNLMTIGDLTRLHGGKYSSLLLEDDGPSFTTTTDFHWGPNTFLPDETQFDIFSTAVPVQKIDTSSQRITSAPSTIRTNSTLSTNCTNTASVSKHHHHQHHHNNNNNNNISNNSSSANQFTGPPHHHQHPQHHHQMLQNNNKPSGAFGGSNNINYNYNNNNNVMSNVHNKSDPYADSFKVANKFDVNERQPFFKDNMMGPRGDQGASRQAPPQQQLQQPQQPQQQPQQHPPPPVHGFDRRNQFHEPPPLPQARLKSPPMLRSNDFDGDDFGRGERRANNHNSNNDMGYNHNNGRASHARDEFAPKDARVPFGRPPGRQPMHSGRDEHLPREQMLPSPPPPPPSQQPSAIPFDRQMAGNHREQPAQMRGNARGGPEVPEGRLEQPRFANGGPGPRDNRRMEGGGERPFEREREPRQPKFSAANYRLPGRPPANQPPRDQFMANRGEPEADANLNWRSKQSVEPVRGDNLAQSTHEKPDEVNRSDRGARLGLRDYREPNDQANAKKIPQQKVAANIEVAQTIRNEASRFRRPQQAINAMDYDGLQNNQHSPPVSENIVQQKFVNSSNQVHRFEFDEQQPQQQQLRPTSQEQVGRGAVERDDPNSMQSNRFHGRYNNQEPPSYQGRDQAYQQPQRNNGPPPPPPASAPRFNPQMNEMNDRRERDHIDPRFPPIESTPANDRRPAQQQQQQQQQSVPPRFREEQQERGRNHGQPFGRNQSFEAHRSPEVTRAKDWRKEGPFPPIKRDQVQAPAAPVVSGPPLPKPPTRMSEMTDFSLRPSHNLIGRSHVVEPQAQQSADKRDVARGLASNVNSDTRLDTRAQTDGAHATGGKQASAGTESHEADNKNAPDDGPQAAARDFHVGKFMSLVKQMVSANAPDTSKVASKVKELKIPKSFHQECLLSIMKQSIIGMDIDRENTSKLLVSLVPNIFESNSLLSAFRVIFEQMHALEAETPKVKTLVAEFLSRSVVDGLLTLEDVAGVLSGGKHHPLFLLLLQKLEKGGGQAWLSEKFVASKINLMDMLPEADRTKDRLASALKDRCLGFLDPMLTIEPDLWQQMKTDPSPAAVYRWIKDNVDQSIQVTPTFAHVFIACLLRYVHGNAVEKFKNNPAPSQSDSDDSNKSSPSSSSAQAVNEFEKELLSKYQQVLQALLKDRPMQLATLYAVQAFYHALDFPKGALLRWFHMLYDMSIVDDDVFFIWKEEINNEFPGKGQALFQVNTWLNWLAESEDEDEEEA